MSSPIDNPADEWPDPGEHAPNGFKEEPPINRDTTPKGETIELVFHPDEQPDLPECPYDVSVVVLQTPMLYLAELRITGLNESGTDVVKTYAAGEARSVGNQMKTGDAPRLAEKLGEEAVEIVGDYLLAAGAMCGTLAIGETAGMDVMEAFQNGQITAEEFMHEFSRNIDKELDRQ